MLLVVMGALGLVWESSATALRSRRIAQEPDTACGKGFSNLVQGSQDYYATAAVELWTHPYHTMDNATFEQEFQCWFASMCTTKCGNLPSKASERKDKLTTTCKSTKKDFPSDEVQDEGESTVHYKQAMETAKEVSKKELLCLTLFTIDDECVKWPYIRLGK